MLNVCSVAIENVEMCLGFFALAEEEKKARLRLAKRTQQRLTCCKTNYLDRRER